jgi:hypothetical protein
VELYGPTYQLRADGSCAVCDTPVKAVEGAAARQKVDSFRTLYRARAWCTLLPCGHTFTVRRGGLIH